MLLLDAENLKIDINAEKFLANISEYSLQVKIAFANWKNSSLSKYDAELFERGYQLIHVPEGKNSADAQMMSMGAAIGRQYSDAKAVFVCSSDWLLTHLCNSLQNQGLIVYRVRRQLDNVLSIENRNTLEVRNFCLKMAIEIPHLSQINSTKNDIFLTQNIATKFVENSKNTHSNTVDLPQINSQADFEQELMKIISNIPVKKNQIFVKIKLVNQKFMVIFGEDTERVLKYLKINNNLIQFFKLSSRFRIKKNSKSKEYQVAIAQNLQTLNSQIISSPEELEKALVSIIKVLAADAPCGYICISNIGTEFQKQYSNSITTILKQLKLSGKLIDFLKSSDAFNIKKVGDKYQVAITQNKQSLNLQIISSPEELEKALVSIIKVLAADAPRAYICMSSIGSEFQKQYNHSISTILKRLKLTGKFIDFLNSSNCFNIKKIGNKYEVAIAQNLQSLNSQIISSPEELEKALVSIIKVLAADTPRDYIYISNIGTAFQKQYSHSISTILKQLKLSGKFLDFLKSSNTFNLKKVGSRYQVAIVNKK
ncbi:MAG: NYN domain-containing protein [Cyanobacteria bacterium P01_H01_bin.35]